MHAQCACIHTYIHIYCTPYVYNRNIRSLLFSKHITLGLNINCLRLTPRALFITITR